MSVIVHRESRGLAGLAIPVLLLSSALAGGCATDRQVYVDLPLTRLELPESAPRRFGAGPSTGEAFRLELTPDQTTTSPDPDRPRLSLEGNGQFRFDVQFAAPVMVGLKAYGGGVVGLQAKWSLFSPGQDGGRASLALTVAYADGDSKFNFGMDSRTAIKQKLGDVAVIAGWRVRPYWLVFGGPYYSRLNYKGNYFSERGSDPDVNMDFAGDATLTGANLGLAFTPQNWLQIMGEYSRGRVEAGAAGDRAGRLAIAIEFFFGAKMRAPDIRETEPPVEVVPPIEEVEPDAS